MSLSSSPTVLSGNVLWPGTLHVAKTRVGFRKKEIVMRMDARICICSYQALLLAWKRPVARGWQFYLRKVHLLKCDKHCRVCMVNMGVP